MFRTPPLQTRRLEVYRAMFQMQLPDTVEAIRKQLREWCAVHVILSETGTTRRSVTRDQIRTLILEQLGADGAVLDPGVEVDNPVPPTGTIYTVMPDAIRPRIATEYSGWTYLGLRETRRRVMELAARAWGGPPDPKLGLAEIFFRGRGVTPALDGSASTTALPSFLKVIEPLVNRAAKVTFFDQRFGFEAPAVEFLGHADRVLSHVGGREDRLYFDPGATWFTAVDGGGRIRVGTVA